MVDCRRNSTFRHAGLMPIMRGMRVGAAILLVLVAVAMPGCSRSGDKVWRSYLGPERATMSVVTLGLGSGVRTVVIRERELDRSEYGTMVLAPGDYTLTEDDGASITFHIRRNVVDEATARHGGELILGHAYTLHAGKGSDGERAFWIEDARTGQVFVDTR
jgi:hypothetical protein